MKIGYRTIKTAIATPIAISIAQLLGVSNVVSAGIVTILCIQPSRKKSVESAWHRFLACILAIVFSIFFFELFGYNPITLGLLLAIFIPTTVLLKIEQGMLTSIVISLNLYGFGSIKIDFLFDQFLLIIIGIGTGLIVNLYMPSLDKKLKEKQKLLEDNFQIILYEIALYIREQHMTWDGKEITVVEKLLEEAEELVERDRENHLLRDDQSYFNYFRMRKKQFELLQQMLPLVTRLPEKDDISERIASFFEKLSEAVHPGNTAILFLDELSDIRAAFKKEDLPATQEEFETRASLYQLLHEIEEYLLLKSKFKKSDIKHGKKEKKTGTV
ncbi:aromatic acid exporter family protein [Pseudogracilibacillus auburnensis]|uniref:Uncharacterized membrane protein YgaE (UPF0421/DUF939 family) n=1 Tax=Pseudogracilibacillus auburnensis TaxID=1494959 RepID=A0A2V3VTK6_9BACI|nr:aromatic acid exporter family protein [Pseudogracilibacillus auburnensis]MBO1004324.1 aromatic acid exporter family protein [Pseudogracilibacillus auburnensis]PXW85076.1 uncharacterized membrane protein YgaE (UPF0421/DUF939 family) [Pseudogracilibacillus auburnensis]